VGVRQHRRAIARAQRLASPRRDEADIRPLAPHGVCQRRPRRAAEGRQRCELLDVDEVAAAGDARMELPARCRRRPSSSTPTIGVGCASGTMSRDQPRKVRYERGRTNVRNENTPSEPLIPMSQTCLPIRVSASISSDSPSTVHFLTVKEPGEKRRTECDRGARPPVEQDPDPAAR
jgi:hypothetical protein